MRQNNVYEERLVAFVDILGFRSIIKRTETDQDLTQSVRNILRYGTNLRDENRAGTYPECDVVGRQVTIFSDSIVISYPTTSPSCLFYLIYDTVFLQMNMFNNGFAVRGGIALGDLYHQRDIVFGPALIDAYDLETQSAIYPRVVVIENTIETGLTKNPHNPAEHERSHILAMLQKDVDGLYYVDFLNQRYETDHLDEYISMLKQVRHLVVHGMTLDAANIQQKYSWLKNKYNAAIRSQGMEAVVSLIP